MRRSPLFACCAIFFMLSAAITFKLASDDVPTLSRTESQSVIADTPAIVVPPMLELDSRREELKRIIRTIEATPLEPALPIVGIVRKKDGTPIAGATIVATADVDKRITPEGSYNQRLTQWIEGEVREERVNSERWQTTSDESGRFELTDLILTRYRISVEHPQWSFNRAKRNTIPGSLVVFLAQEPKLEIELEVRLADGSVPSQAEVAIGPGRLDSHSKRSTRSLPSGTDDTKNTLINQVVSRLVNAFKPWTATESTREVEPGYHTAIARSTDGHMSDPVEVFIGKSAGKKQRVQLEIVQSGTIQIDLVQSDSGTRSLQYYLMQIDQQLPPPASALFGGLTSVRSLRTWPQTIPRVPAGTYLVGIGSRLAIWNHQIVEVTDQPVEVVFDLSEPNEGNFLFARVVDSQGLPMRATFQCRSSRKSLTQNSFVESLFLKDDGICRIALSEEDYNSDQLFLSAKTKEGSIEVEVGNDFGQVIEFRFGSSAKVNFNFSGFNELWKYPPSVEMGGYAIQAALVPAGEPVSQTQWKRIGPLSWLHSEPEEYPEFLSKHWGSVQAGVYELAVATDMHNFQNLELLRVPITVGNVDLEIPIALPTLYNIEVLQSGLWPFTIDTPHGISIFTSFEEKDEKTVVLPAGTFQFSSGPIKQTIDVPRQRQVDLRGEER